MNRTTTTGILWKVENNPNNLISSWMYFSLDWVSVQVSATLQWFTRKDLSLKWRIISEKFVSAYFLVCDTLINVPYLLAQLFKICCLSVCCRLDNDRFVVGRSGWRRGKKEVRKVYQAAKKQSVVLRLITCVALPVESASFFFPSTSLCSLSSWLTSSCIYHLITVTIFAHTIYHSLNLSLQT